MKQETIEEALNSEIKLVHDVVRNKDFDLGFQTGGIFGAKWKAERMYTEEDMINFANFKTNNLMKHVDKTGFYLGTNKVLEIWKEEFKKK